MSYYRRKRSLGQGNVFTPVCHSVQGDGVVGFLKCITGHMTSIWGQSAPRRGQPTGGLHLGGLPTWGEGGLHPGSGPAYRGSAAGADPHRN